MKKYFLKTLCLSAMLLSFISCSNDDNSILTNEIEGKTNAVNLYGINVENVDGTLSFENESSLKEAVKIVSDYSTPVYMVKSESLATNLTEIKKLKETGFRSMYDLFVDAMNDAESYYEREGGYEEFKAKYPTLYFPEAGDDYSAYMPIMDNDLAKLADVNGNVIINGNIVSLKDVTSYKQLQDVGLAPPENYNVLRADGEYENGIPVQVVKKNKVWVNVHEIMFHRIPVVFVEVCFRKKNGLGIWYNHNSGTSARLESAGRGNLGVYNQSMDNHFGFSSHNYKYSVRSNGIDTYPVNEYVTITHAGTGLTLKLKVKFDVRMI